MPPASRSPDLMTADADEPIEGQYADRPQLRPILDAVLALLPALGPATVQARKTIVSLVSPGPDLCRGAGDHQGPGGPGPAS